MRWTRDDWRYWAALVVVVLLVVTLTSRSSFAVGLVVALVAGIALGGVIRLLRRR